MPIIHVNSEAKLKKFNKMNKKGKIVVAFVATWCGHCQNLKPLWKKMEKKLKNKGTIVMIYSDFRERANISSNVNGYPTIKTYINGKGKESNINWEEEGNLEKAVSKFFSGKSFKKRTRKRTRKIRRKRKRRRTRKKY